MQKAVCGRFAALRRKGIYMDDIKLKSLITEYIEAHTDEMVEDIMTLCRIASVKGEPKSGRPYGDGPYTALMKAHELISKYGFETRIYDNRVISGDLNDKERKLDILAHMDVVAPGDGWTVTDPFEPVIQNGRIYARGASDDKGPAMAALYAMRAVKELGIDLNGSCRLVLGSDEECGSSDLPYYFAEEDKAPMTFSPDHEFPVANVEKGHLKGKAVWSRGQESQGDTSGKRLKTFECGDTINIVPGKGRAIVSGFDMEEVREAVSETEAEIKSISKEKNTQFTVDLEYSGKNIREADADITDEDSCSAKDICIRITGCGAHASTPYEGVNAGTLLLNILSKLKFEDEILNEKLKSLEKLFPYGDHYGKALGMDVSDEISGATTVSPDIFRGNSEGLSLSFDARTAVSADEENTLRAAEKRIRDAGFAFEYSIKGPHYVSADSEFIKTLLKQYELVTGKPGRCTSTGGGTYVHDIENGVAFGAVGESTDTHMHGADEFMPVSELKEAAVIYAMSIVRLLNS